MKSAKELLEAAIAQGASDLHLAVGRAPTLRVDGRLRSLGDELLTADAVMGFIREISPEKHLRLLHDRGGSDFSYEHGRGSIFRVSIFRQRGQPSAVLRLIPRTKRTLEEIGLGPAVREILFRQRGLVLITGPTGSGKSTTLAAMIDVINTERECNIITIEDPIEYRHEHKRSIVVQREVGEDVPSFEEALVRALRQDPDVILVGEMRNLETIEAAIRAAETGHLVFSTLHTTGAARTVDRIVDVFPPSSRDEIRTQLAGTLLCVISQQLLPRISGGRIAAFEIMFNTPAIAAYIRENKTYRITSDLQTGAKLGMCTMDASLIELYLRKEITYQDMMLHCYDPALITKLLSDVAASAQKKR
ncbi:MAG: type IV pilus twitching motility protein PilT [bacterium]|nr:type IV pilus twitching motility protein PilT [bacterium]